MHHDEIDSDSDLVRRLLREQRSQWADLPIEPVSSTGTDNARYRLGDHMVVRLPLRPSSVGPADKEHRWLLELAPHLPLGIAVPLVRGEPTEGYRWPWSVHPWFEGEDATRAQVDLRQAAFDLAGFIAALQSLDPTGGPKPSIACDLIVAWELFDAESREVLRTELAVDDATWERSRGWALSTAMLALPYYQHTNAFMAAQARHKLGCVLNE